VKNDTVNKTNNLPQHKVGKAINPSTEYSLIVMFSTLGASLLLSCADLVSMYLSIELQSFGVYILSTLYRDSESATSAGLKYFLLGGLSSCIILLGSALIYSYTGLTNFESIYSLVSVSYSNQIIHGLTLGFILIFINLLFISSLLSLIIGTVVGLAQTKIKRLLAYSTISHIGFILLALAINTEQSTESLIFYIIQYSFTNLNVFLIIIALGYLTHINKFINGNFYGSNIDIRFISELNGQFFLNPILSIILTICLFSMAGVPPLLGFFSKQFVLYSAVQSGYYFMSIVAILVS